MITVISKITIPMPCNHFPWEIHLSFIPRLGLSFYTPQLIYLSLYLSIWSVLHFENPLLQPYFFKGKTHKIKSVYNVWLHLYLYLCLSVCECERKPWNKLALMLTRWQTCKFLVMMMKINIIFSVHLHRYAYLYACFVYIMYLRWKISRYPHYLLE